MTYNKLKELVDTVLVRDTYDSDKVVDILKKVQTYDENKDLKILLLIDLLSGDILFGDGENVCFIMRALGTAIPDKANGTVDVLRFIAHNAGSIPATRNIMEYYNTEIGFSQRDAEMIQDSIDFYCKISKYGFYPNGNFWTEDECSTFYRIEPYLKRFDESAEINALNSIYTALCEYYPNVKTTEEAKQYLLDHTDGDFCEKVVEAQQRELSGGNTEEAKNITKVLKSSAPELLKWAMLKQYFMTNHPKLSMVKILKRMKPMLREQDFAHLGMLLMSADLPKQESEVPALVDEWLRRFPSALVQTLDKYDRLYLCYELTVRLLPF